MKKREIIIRRHLKSMEEAKKRLPKQYHPIEGITEIRYGFFNIKTITAEEIENYRKSL